MNTRFDLFRADSGRTYLKVYTGRTHYMITLDENELATLRDRLDHPPRAPDRDGADTRCQECGSRVFAVFGPDEDDTRPVCDECTTEE